VLVVWTTDPHLNHVRETPRERWISEIASHGADGIVISGDISEGDDVVFQLQRIAQSSSVPVYFVLGNHDFYGRSISETRQDVIRASRDSRLLHYLTDLSPIGLAENVFLVGEDGWGDATEGDYEGSTIRLNDFPLIDDFRRARPEGWKQQLQLLGAQSAERLRVKLDALPEDARAVLVITHVPPFRDACWYQGKTTDDNWAPFFVCGQIGRVLQRAGQSRPACQFTVLCGHAHNAGTAQMAANLVVHTGAAQYGYPAINGLVHVQDDGLSVVQV
jgi:predicted phosphohydrolase